MNGQKVIKICGFSVVEREDGMCNATELINKFNNNNPDIKQNLDEFLNWKETRAFIKMLEEEHNAKDAIIDKQGDVVWLHPMLLTNLAYNLDVQFEQQTARIVCKHKVQNITTDKRWSVTLNKILGATPQQRERIEQHLAYAVLGNYNDDLDFATGWELERIREYKSTINIVVGCGFIKDVDDVCELLQNMRYIPCTIKRNRYDIVINSHKLLCDNVEDAIEVMERAIGYDVDAIFSEGYTFSIYDDKKKVVVATNESITHLATERNECESAMLYTYLREYAADHE